MVHRMRKQHMIGCEIPKWYKVVESMALCQYSACVVLQAILIWWEADPDVRSTELPNLLSTIRLSPSELQHQVLPELQTALLKCSCAF